LKTEIKPLYTPARINAQVARMGREISRDYAGRTLDVLALLEDSFIFAADLVRHIRTPLVCHFVRAESHMVQLGSAELKEIFFAHPPDLRGRDVLLVDTVLDTGITLDFLIKRLQEARPRSLRMAILFDRPESRRVDMHPDYIGFPAASNYLVGYGLSSVTGLYRNLPFVGSPNGSRRKAASRQKGSKRRKKQGRVGK
jgi:hypoxanthine phosphoribosyltransferase